MSVPHETETSWLNEELPWYSIDCKFIKYFACSQEKFAHTYTLFYLCKMWFWPCDRFHSWSPTLMFSCCMVLYKWPTVWLNPHVGQHTWDVSPPPPDLLTNRSRACVMLPLHSILGCLLIHPHILIQQSINYPEIQSVVTCTCSASASYHQTFPLLGLPVDLLLLWPAFASSSGALKAAFWRPV